MRRNKLHKARIPNPIYAPRELEAKETNTSSRLNDSSGALIFYLQLECAAMIMTASNIYLNFSSITIEKVTYAYPSSFREDKGMPFQRKEGEAEILVIRIIWNARTMAIFTPPYSVGEIRRGR
ncbi:hypothetical protein [Bacillus sp. MUM 13]|uniref:hypothetical protein n=1 Tax=Bacillus sp. MUM 13 TaxID=1678001 RepID=UPI0011142825|nr:hypothetical protein [Bacillus sp. MUM 13]